jgi:hypothetical protein
VGVGDGSARDTGVENGSLSPAGCQQPAASSATNIKVMNSRDLIAQSSRWGEHIRKNYYTFFAWHAQLKRTK